MAIVPFRDEFAGDFERLNREWLEAYSLLESEDLPYLREPRKHIIEAGGEILFALDQGRVVGTVALIRQSGGVFELAKLAVASEARGRGLGRRLTLAAIDRAASAGAERIVLSSSTRLREAVALYESLGFRHTESVPGVAYASADVFMQLKLDPGA